MTGKVTLNLFHLIKQVEIAENRNITSIEVAREAGIHEQTIYRALRGELGGVQFETIEKLLGYFRNHGMTVTVNDLIAEGNDEGKAVPASPVLAGVAVR